MSKRVEEAAPAILSPETTVTTIRTCVVRAETVDALPIKKQFSASTRYFPDNIEAEYRSTNGGEWELVYLTLSGPGVTKGGRSKSSVHSDRFSVWLTGYAPQWARRWAEAHMPGEDVAS